MERPDISISLNMLLHQVMKARSTCLHIRSNYPDVIGESVLNTLPEEGVQQRIDQFQQSSPKPPDMSIAKNREEAIDMALKYTAERMRYSTENSDIYNSVEHPLSKPLTNVENLLDEIINMVLELKGNL